MNKPNWTPGPLTWIDADDWRETAERGQCFTLADADSNDVADIYHSDHATVPTTPEQAAAYARLFAAAPLLAEVLAEIVATDNAAIASLRAMGMEPDPQLTALTDRARAALSAARGES